MPGGASQASLPDVPYKAQACEWSHWTIGAAQSPAELYQASPVGTVLNRIIWSTPAWFPKGSYLATEFE
jgi:hypothetical protein